MSASILRYLERDDMAEAWRVTSCGSLPPRGVPPICSGTKMHLTIETLLADVAFYAGELRVATHDLLGALDDEFRKDAGLLEDDAEHIQHICNPLRVKMELKAIEQGSAQGGRAAPPEELPDVKR